MYYLFINENQIEKYNGEILKRYVGNRLVKAISNPTDDNLKEFGYMELIENTEPEYDTETQYVSKSYYVQDGKIYEKYSVEELDDIIDDTEIIEEVEHDGHSNENQAWNNRNRNYY